MRWIDGSSSPAEDETPRQEVLTAALRSYSHVMETVEEAHGAAARALAGAQLDGGRTPAPWQESAQAHTERAQAYAEQRTFTEQISSFSTKALSSLDPQDFRSLTVHQQLSPAVQTPSRLLGETLEAGQRLPAGRHGISHPPLELRIGVIGDDAGWARFAGQAELVRITPANWGSISGLDLLLVTAPFTDAEGWGQADQLHPALVQEVLPSFRRAGVPTVFTALAEPLAFEQSAGLAAACDRIATPRAESVESYRASCPQARSVDVLPASVNPLIHTPIGSRPAASDLVLLAGTPAEPLSAQVAEYAEPLIDGLAAAQRPAAFFEEHGTLHIPAEHALSTFRRLPVQSDAQQAVPGLLRSVDIAAAVSPHPASQTAVEQQVLDLQACGTMVLSTYSQGVNSYYPQVYIANDAADVAKTLDTLTLEELRRVQNDGLRKVFRDNHARDALAQICTAAGLEIEDPEQRVVAVAEEITEQLRGAMDAQTIPVELLSWEELAQDPEQNQLTMLLPVSPALHYAPNYALDQLTTFAYQDAAVVTKLLGSAEQTDHLAHRHHSGAAEEIFALERSAWWRPSTELLESASGLRRAAAETTVYAGDHIGVRRAPSAAPKRVRRSFDEIIFGGAAQKATLPPPPPGSPRARRSAEASAESSAASREASDRTRVPAEVRAGVGRRTPAQLIEGEDLSAAGERFRRTARSQDLELAVVVPIYNNGDHLRHKAFASLRRSSIFTRMHILLINDGSTDPGTTETVEELAAAWPNVSAFHHGRGGSGSASRPRNTGLALTHTPFVTYLDPDDEELAEGYSELLDTLRAHPEANFSLGNMAVWTNRLLVQDYHDWFSQEIEQVDGLFRPTRDSLVRIRFRPASIEAMVARTDWLQSLGLEQPVGAVGQDTFFFQQLLYHTEAYAPVFRPVYTYYGAVETSIVNVVSPNYFRKYLGLEQARAAWLEEIGLKQEYLETRFERFFITWYLRKLKQVPEAQRTEAAEVLHQIAALYGDHRWKDLEARRFFKRHPRQQLNDPLKDA